MIPSCPCSGEPVDELPLSSDDQQRSLPATFPPLTTSKCLTIPNTAVLP